MNKTRHGIYRNFMKRVIDFFVAFVMIIVTFPVAIVCALAIKLDDPKGSILFCQDRNGKHGKVFKMIKFRTMKRQLSGGPYAALENTLTRVGKPIRKLSVDEIPQLLNILCGQMSLIGPRPLPIDYYEWFNDVERARFDVLPGLTGLAQINGRANLNWDERFQYDVKYVENLSFLFDLKILLKSIRHCFFAERRYHRAGNGSNEFQRVQAKFNLQRKTLLKTAIYH